MKKHTYYICCIAFLFFYLGACGQGISDSLANKSYQDLQNVIDNSYDNNFLQPYLKAYLNKAKAENNLEKIRQGYKNYMYATTPQKELKYADSLLLNAQKINTKDVLADAYLQRATIYYSKKNYKSSLDNLLEADINAKSTDNDILKTKIKHGIANIKYYLGHYDEALELFKECSAYFKQNGSSEGYLSSEYSISLTYNKLKEYDKCSQVNAEAFAYAKKINDTISIAYINNSEGVNQYCKENYAKAISLLKASLPELCKLNDLANITTGYFYIGSSFLALKKQQAAYKYFNKVDSIFINKKYIKPELRENFEILLENAKNDDNIQSQLYYTNRLIQVDSVLNINYKYLSEKVHKEYDTKNLISEKKRIESELSYRRTVSIILYIALSIFFFTTLIITYKYYKNQKKYKLRFEELMDKLEVQNTLNHDDTTEKEMIEDTADETENDTDNESKKPDINPDVVNKVLDQLKKFEEKKQFLKKDITLNSLASQLNTNSNYLSKIINHYKQKTFSNYLNDLRVTFIVTLLRKEPRYRNFTIKALAEEAGFTNPQHFSKAFYAQTGIYPSFFINELNKGKY